MKKINVDINSITFSLDKELKILNYKKLNESKNHPLNHSQLTKMYGEILEIDPEIKEDDAVQIIHECTFIPKNIISESIGIKLNESNIKDESYLPDQEILKKYFSYSKKEIINTITKVVESLDKKVLDSSPKLNDLTKNSFTDSELQDFVNNIFEEQIKLIQSNEDFNNKIVNQEHHLILRLLTNKKFINQ
jgi:hypothetical protein